MRFTAGVLISGIVSMLIWGCFTCGWNPLCGIFGVILGIFVVVGMGLEFVDNF